MKKWIINMGILTGIWMVLTGCGALKTQAVMDTEMAEEEETESQVWPGLLGEPGKKAEEIVSFLEQFEGGLSFRDMEKERAASYGGPLEDSYAFYGRETEDGAGYVLGIKIRKESLLDGLTVYGEDDHMEAVIQNDQDGGYDTVYVLDDISVFLAGPAQDAVLNEVLYLQPEDMETPEEILTDILGEFGLEILKKMPVQFHCDCERSRVEKAIISIGRKEIQDMIDEGKEIEVNCQFCNKHYKFSVDELGEMLKKATRE